MHDDDEHSAFTCYVRAALQNYLAGNHPLMQDALDAAMDEPEARMVPEVADMQSIFYFLLAQQWRVCANWYADQLEEARQAAEDEDR